MGQNADSFPIEGWDHLEFYVGNAKQAAFYYQHAFGFTPTAYAGPETGVRDRASYVLEQDDIRFVLTTGLRGDSEVARFPCVHGDGVKDVAMTVPDAGDAYRQTVERGARGLVEPPRGGGGGRGAAASRTGARTSGAASSWPRSRRTARTCTRSSIAPITRARISRAFARFRGLTASPQLAWA